MGYTQLHYVPTFVLIAQAVFLLPCRQAHRYGPQLINTALAQRRAGKKPKNDDKVREVEREIESETLDFLSS